MSSIFNSPDFAPYQSDWKARTERYNRSRHYYYGVAYEAIKWRDTKIYEGTRTLFSPLRRVVRVDVAKIPAGWALPKEASEATRARVKELRKLTQAEIAYQRFLRYGGVAGEAGLMLSGEKNAPVISALRPDELVLGQLRDGTPFALVIKRSTRTAQSYLGQTYAMSGTVEEYAQVITAQTIRTYKDGEAHSYDGQPSERPNAFGFIPVVFAPYIEGEDGCGESAFAGVLNLLDRVNEIASLTLDTIARNAEPVVVGTGVDTIDRDEESDALLIKSADAKMFTLDPKLAIAETLAFIQDVRAEFKTLLPQLLLDQLSTRSDLAYETVVTLLQELGDHVAAVRTSVDLAVETIERWIMGVQGGVPDDYELDRDRRWLTLTESQQLDLELKQLEIEDRKKTAQESPPAPSTSPTPGAAGQETPINAT